MPTIRPYDRAPSPELQKLLQRGEFLEPLLSLANENTAGVGLDVHFRRNDEIHVYCGMTRLITAQALWGGDVKVAAHKTYASQSCAKDLFRTWRTGETGLNKALTTYIRSVKIGPRWTKAEGAVQMQWSRVHKPWVPIDREVVLERQAEAMSFPKVRLAFGELTKIAKRDRWEAPKAGSVELDQLAVDSRGHLVLIELKDASKRTGDVYYAPFQLLQYVWVWHDALDLVRDGVQALIEARVAVGLTPRVRGISGGIRPVIGFGRDLRSPEVKRRYEIALKIANNCLPRCVPKIELWEHTGSRLRQVG